jgi:alpha-galactosidase
LVIASASLTFATKIVSLPMHFRQATLIIDQNKTLQLQAGKANSFEALYVHFDVDASRGHYSIFIHPKQDISIQRLEIQFDLQLHPDTRILCNGFQSWSETRQLRPGDSIPRLRPMARRMMGFYGDEHLPDVPRGAGFLHSWSYICIQEPHQEALLLGSLNERTGFTLFAYDQPNAVLTVRKDIGGLQLTHSFPALEFVICRGETEAVYDAYFAALAIEKPSAPPSIGWTSWYQYFTHVSEDIVLKNLASFRELCPEPGAIFQIDDGWQTCVGDWLSAKPTFPKGMGDIAAQIRAAGCLPGLWLAPFVVAKDSEILRKNPEWLLKAPNGKPLRAGWNPMWGGWYYVLDFYHPAVREYLSGVLHMATEKWGYALLKLDFLFAVCLAPPPTKTRGQVMYEAMEFLRHNIGSKRMLACGVPLGAAFGLADYCRIGGDIHLRWEHRLLAFLRHRERVSTLASLRSTLNRWPLNGRAFQNDPDVYILRKETQHLSPAQQYTVLIVNILLGNLWFTSDDVGTYSEEQKTEWQQAMAWRGSRVESVTELSPELYAISFAQDADSWTAYVNLNARPQAVWAGKEMLELEAYETMVLGK